MPEISWEAHDNKGVVHQYRAMSMGVMESLQVLEMYKAYKYAQMAQGSITPNPSWISKILWEIPARHCFRDGVAMTVGEAELTYGNGNVDEMYSAAEERARAEGFFDSWMRSLIYLHTAAKADKSEKEPPAS